jgi:hypothetical protein
VKDARDIVILNLFDNDSFLPCKNNKSHLRNLLLVSNGIYPNHRETPAKTMIPEKGKKVVLQKDHSTRPFPRASMV